MAYNIYKKSFFFLAVTVLVPTAYVIGIGSNPNYAFENPKIQIVKKEIIPIETALRSNRPTVSTALNTASLENPFQNGKIYKIPNKEKKQKQKPDIFKTDPRITTIDLSSFEDSENNINDELIIEIPSNKQSPMRVSEKQDSIKVASLEKPLNADLFSADAYKESRKALLKAPLSDYVQTSPYGALPYQSDKLMPLYKRYGNNTLPEEGKRYLSMIVGGLGMNEQLTLEAIKTLPPEVTLGFIPYTKDLQKYIDLAREYGHETILEIPLESYDYPRSDVGHKVLLTSLESAKNKDRFYWLLGRATGYSGVMNYLGGKFILDPQMKSLLGETKKRGLYFVENKTIKSGLARAQAKDVKAYYQSSSEILDSKLNPEFIKTQMMRAEEGLSSENFTTVTAYASPLTLSILRYNLLQYKQKNIQLLPVSSTIQ